MGIKVVKLANEIMKIELKKSVKNLSNNLIALLYGKPIAETSILKEKADSLWIQNTTKLLELCKELGFPPEELRYILFYLIIAHHDKDKHQDRIQM